MTQEQYFAEFYKKALQHKLDHSCGGQPYEDYNQLFEHVWRTRPKRVLEIGTAIGFTAAVIKSAKSECILDTIDYDFTHSTLAKENLKEFKNINFLTAEAKDILPLLQHQYDLIFFDGYSPQFRFLVEFNRLLKRNGILISANCHLKGPAGSTKDQYIQEISDPTKWKLLDQFNDTKVLQKLT
jgi:predicted O-methyltransferase YrrM